MAGAWRREEDAHAHAQAEAWFREAGGWVVSRLTPGQPVMLNVEGEKSELACVVATLDGNTAMLVQSVAGDPQLMDRLARRRKAYLLFPGPGTVVGLRGAVAAPPATRPLIEFVLTDS
jgi:hypothetical protein